VKVHFEDDIRRFSCTSSSFAALKEEIYKKYSFKPQARALIKYTDEDGDLITITDDGEFADAIRNIKQGALKLVVSHKKKVLKEVVQGTTATPGDVPTAPAPIATAPVLASTSPLTNAQPLASVPLYPTLTQQPIPFAPMQAVQPLPMVPAYVPPFKNMDRKARSEHLQQFREHKKKMCEHKRAAKYEKKVEKQCHKLHKTNLSQSPKLLARFVKDVGVEEGIQLAPNTKFIKTWRFRNEGTTAWPTGSKLMFISWKGGDQMSGPEGVIIPVEVLPGAEVDISIELIAPAAIGRYAGHYRLCTPEGKKFGDRVRNLVYVVDPSSPSSSSEEEMNPSYAAALAQLEQMGFRNKKCNAKILNRFHGDLNKAIQKLVRKQRKAERKH